MRISGLQRVLVLLPMLQLLLAPSAIAETPVVMITSPPAGEVVFGEVEIAFDILGLPPEDILRAEVFVDDQFVESLSQPPWKTRFDVGEENRPHRFEVLVETRGGERSSALLVSREIQVDLEIEAPLQQLYVTVEDRRGQRVLNLDAEGFEVLDSGAKQRIVTFERGDVPLAAVLLVDASDSMRGRPLAAATAGATAFVDRLGELDQAQVVLFSDRILYQTPFTSFAEVLRVGLQRIEANGGTALDDHLFLALERLETRQGRRVVVLLSDGVDVSSMLDMDDVMASARRSRALIYWLRLKGERNRETRLHTAWRTSTEHRRELDLLQEMVLQSGGRILDLASVDEAAPAFTRILKELREQYVLGFYPSQNLDDGSWHEIEIKLIRRGLDVRHRAGYLD